MAERPEAEAAPGFDVVEEELEPVAEIEGE